MSDAALYHTTAATLASARISMGAAWLLAALACMAILIAPFYGAVYAAVFVAVCAIGISVVMLLIAQKDVGLAFTKLAEGAFGNKMNFARTLRTMAPLMLMALAFSV